MSKPSQKNAAPQSRLSKLRRDRHGPFLFGFVVAVVCLPLLLIYIPRLAAGGTAIVFFLIYLCMMAVRIPHLDGATLKAKGQDEDAPAPVILAVTLFAVIAAVISLFEALNRSQHAGVVDIVLAFASVVLGWITIHTMFALHYAHFYWRPAEQKQPDEGKRGGLDFPQTDDPGAYDFLYFSFVIGMTAQTSDTAITTTTMRKLNLLHAIVSFFFNTVLVAASVNAVVSMGQ